MKTKIERILDSGKYNEHSKLFDELYSNFEEMDKAGTYNLNAGTFIDCQIKAMKLLSIV